MTGRVWEPFLTDRDREVAAVSGYGGDGGFGERPAVLVIDVTTAFCGEIPAPILESVKQWRNSCGEEAWDAIGVIERLLPQARAQGVPVIFSAGTDTPNNALYSGRWANKNLRRGEDKAVDRKIGYQIVAPLTPIEGDIVLRKTKPSVFFGTPLMSYLVDLGVDTLICCGGTTSGCVRATVVDAFSYNFRVCVVEEGTFDRSQASHALNLYDMQQKYADVISADTAMDYLGQLRSGLFEARYRPLHS